MNDTTDAELKTFMAEWTIDVTRERRDSWNARVKAGEIDGIRASSDAAKAQGWSMRDLRKATKLYRGRL